MVTLLFYAAILSQLKIASLDQAKKDAKQKYQTSLDAYVKEYMGKPMEKLQVRNNYVLRTFSKTYDRQQLIA